MVRMSISTAIEEELRTYAITNNEGLGLPNDQLVNFIRNMEGRSKFNKEESVNLVRGNYINRQTKGGWSRNQQQLSTFTKKLITE